MGAVAKSKLSLCRSGTEGHDWGAVLKYNQRSFFIALWSYEKRKVLHHIAEIYLVPMHLTSTSKANSNKFIVGGELTLEESPQKYTTGILPDSTVWKQTNPGPEKESTRLQSDSQDRRAGTQHTDNNPTLRFQLVQIIIK